MEFRSLLEAVEAYLQVKREADGPPLTEPCLDWDCGLATDMEGQSAGFMTAELVVARNAMEEAINRYIDYRVRSGLGQHVQNLPPSIGGCQGEGEEKQ